MSYRVSRSCLPWMVVALMAFVGCSPKGDAPSAETTGGETSSAATVPVAGSPTPARVASTDRNATNRIAPADDDDSPERIARDMLQASLRESQGDVAGAIDLWESALERLERSVGADSWEYRTAEVGLAQARQRIAFTLPQRTMLVEIADLERRGDRRVAEGDNAAALDYFVAALEKAAEVWGDRSHVTLSLRRKVAAQQEATGDDTAALASYLAVIGGRTSLYGESHPYVFEAIGDLARFHQHRERYDLAVQQATRRLSGCTALFGAESIRTAEAHNDLGAIYHDAQDPARAAREFERSLELRRRLTPEDDGAIAFAERALALTRLASGNTTDAESLLDDAIERLGRTADSTAAAEMKLQRGTARMAQERFAEAEQDYREARETLAGSLDLAPLPYAESCFKLGYVLGRQGRYPEAAPLLDEALRIQSLRLAPGDPVLRRTEEIVALVRSKLEGTRVGAQPTTLR